MQNITAFTVDPHKYNTYSKILHTFVGLVITVSAVRTLSLDRSVGMSTVPVFHSNTSARKCPCQLKWSLKGNHHRDALFRLSDKLSHQSRTEPRFLDLHVRPFSKNTAEIYRMYHLKRKPITIKHYGRKIKSEVGPPPV